MPELPEVESTARYLHERVAGSRISTIYVGWARTVSGHNPDEFAATLTDAEIRSVGRRGKFVCFQLALAGPNRKQSEATLFAHMRMSGSFDVVSVMAPRSKHDHIVFQLGDQREVRFHDPRKFGRFQLALDPNEVLSRIGIDPFDQSLTRDLFYQMVRQKRGRIKPLLLNQKFLSGVGNIYADEALWSAKIHPMTIAERISRARADLLLNNLRRILLKAIAASGTDNGDGVVDGGLYRPRAYGRDGLPCFRCKAPLKRILVGQRGTTFCKVCQRR